MLRTATCRCGAVRLEARGEPRFQAVCHCDEGKRTGSGFGRVAGHPDAEVAHDPALRPAG